MSHNNSITAIFYAFAANIGIALAKTGAAWWTGSGSLLAEAIHSYADCGNQVLLLIGIKRSEKAASAKHPMGYGRESYIWSMLVAITLFSVGGLFSVYEGGLRLMHPHGVENGGIAVGILLAAVVLEAFSLWGALAAIREEKGRRSLWQWFRDTHSSELMVVAGEDIAALAGLVIALIMLALTMLTGNSAFDAAGSIMIGILLIAVALLVGREVHSLLLGESADELRDQIHNFLRKQAEVEEILDIWAINHGNQVLVAIKAQLPPNLLVNDAVRLTKRIQKQIHLDFPRVKWIFFEIDERKPD
jgi:cation diffusion facilitator family transporter